MPSLSRNTRRAGTLETSETVMTESSPFKTILNVYRAGADRRINLNKEK